MNTLAEPLPEHQAIALVPSQVGGLEVSYVLVFENLI